MPTTCSNRLITTTFHSTPTRRFFSNLQFQKLTIYSVNKTPKKKKILFNCLILIKHQLFNLIKKIYNIDPVQSVALNIELKKNLYLIFNNKSLF